jgi:hypothetical protein
LGRAVKSGQLHHAYALVGGKEAILAQVAWATAAAIVCRDPSALAAPLPAGCGVCPGCKKLASGNHPDVWVITPNDKNTITIDMIREGTARLVLRAVESPTKVVLIRSADQMNPAAQNALLKTLEEPPGPTCFFLTVARYRQLLPTIRSRCHRLRMLPPSRQGASSALAAAGIAPDLAELLAPLCGADAAEAAAMNEAGFGEVFSVLRPALAADAGPDTIIKVAAELGQEPVPFRQALTLIELSVRAALCQRHAEPGVRPQGQSTLGPTVGLLQQQRRLVAFNQNRALVLERVLFELHGMLSPDATAMRSAS